MVIKELTAEHEAMLAQVRDEWLAVGLSTEPVTTAAAQGDVSILRVTTAAASTPMPARVDVVRGEAGGNTHSLHPSGACFWDAHTARSVTDLTLGTLTVPDGSTAVLAHPEHGFMEIAAGTYRVGRQREYAGEWAYVAD